MSNYGSGQWPNLQTSSYQAQQPQQQRTNLSKGGDSRSSSSNQQYTSGNHSTVQWPAGQNVNSYYQPASSGDDGYTSGTTSSNAQNARFQSTAGQQYSTNHQNYQAVGMSSNQGNSYNTNQYYNVGSGYYSGDQTQAPSMGTNQPYNTYNQSQQNWNQSFQQPTARSSVNDLTAAPAAGSSNWSNATARTSSATGSVNQSTASNWKQSQPAAPSSHAGMSNSPSLQANQRPSPSTQTSQVPKKTSKAAAPLSESPSTVAKTSTPKKLGRPSKNDPRRADSERRPVGKSSKQGTEGVKPTIVPPGNIATASSSEAAQQYQAFVDPRAVSKAPNPAPAKKPAAAADSPQMPIDPSLEQLLNKVTGDGENEFGEIEEEMTDLLSRLQEYRSKDPTRFTAFWNKLKKIPGKSKPQASTANQEAPAAASATKSQASMTPVPTPSSKRQSTGSTPANRVSTANEPASTSVSAGPTPPAKPKPAPKAARPPSSTPARSSVSTQLASPAIASGPSGTPNAKPMAGPSPSIDSITSQAKINAQALKLKYLIERMPENAQKGTVDITQLEVMIQREMPVSEIAISLRRRGLALPALSVIDQQITEAGQEFQRRYDLASAAIKEKNQQKSQANSAKKRIPGTAQTTSAGQLTQDATPSQAPTGYYAAETNVKSASKSATPMQAAMSKEEQSRKRKIADIIDISISSDEDDDMIRKFPPARPAPMQPQSHLKQAQQQQNSNAPSIPQTTGPRASNLPASSTNISQPKLAHPTAMNAMQMPLPPAGTVQPKELPKTVLPLPPTPQEIAAAEQRRKKLLTIAPQLPEKARNTAYNPATLARDFLIAKGEHPTEKMLNAHFLDLKNNFKSADWRIDLSKIDWDIVDPGGPTPEELKLLRSKPVPKPSPPKEFQSPSRPQSSVNGFHAKMETTPTRGPHPVRPPMPSSPSNSRTSAVVESQSAKGVKLSDERESKASEPAANVSSFMPINAPKHSIAASSTTPMKGKRDVQTSSPYVQAQSSGQQASSTGSPANTMHSAPRKRGRPFSKNIPGRPPVIQAPPKPATPSSTIDLLAESAPSFHVATSTPVTKSGRGRLPVRGLGTGLTRNDAALQSTLFAEDDSVLSADSELGTPQFTFVSGLTRGSRGRPRGSRGRGPTRGRPRGGRLGYVPAERREKTPEDGIAIKVPTSKSSKTVPADEDLDFTDPMLMRGKLPLGYPKHDKDQRDYQVFACEWKGCSGQLHNLETLKKHIAQIHLKPQVISHEEGLQTVVHCEWGSCSHVSFDSAAGLAQHVAQHITEKGARLGEGLIVDPERASSKAYLFGPDGRQVTPWIRLDGPPDPLPAHASWRMTNVYHKAHGNNTLMDRALAEEDSRVRRIEEDGVAVILPEPREALQAMIDDDLSEIYVTDSEKEGPVASTLPLTGDSALDELTLLEAQRVDEALFTTIDELAADDDFDWH